MNRNSFRFAILFAGLVMLILNSCRRGELDPFISFQSRDERLQGNWQLSALSGSVNNTIGTGTETLQDNYVFTFNTTDTTLAVQHSYTDLNTGDLITEIDTLDAYTIIMEIQQGGDCEVTEYYTEGVGGENINTFIGNWGWLGDDNSKTQVYISGLEGTLIENGYWELKGLNVDELVMVHEETKTSSSGTTNTQTEIQWEISFIGG
jgi:hypothetical protein